MALRHQLQNLMDSTSDYELKVMIGGAIRDMHIIEDPFNKFTSAEKSEAEESFIESCNEILEYCRLSVMNQVVAEAMEEIALARFMRGLFEAADEAGISLPDFFEADE